MKVMHDVVWSSELREVAFNLSYALHGGSLVSDDILDPQSLLVTLKSLYLIYLAAPWHCLPLAPSTVLTLVFSTRHQSVRPK